PRYGRGGRLVLGLQSPSYGRGRQGCARAGKPELRECVLLRNSWAGRLRSVRSAGEYVSGSAQAAGKYSMAG
ncbi:MAG: hypothetical protein ACK6EB_35775, partial [Planctomyces sp.]